MFTQTDVTNIANTDYHLDATNQRIALAMAHNDAYQVTAGDVYILTYAVGSNPIVYQTIVDSSYKLRVSNLVVLDVKDKSFLEIKELVEQVVSRNYPLSGVQFTLKNPASFKVLVKGEVSSSGESSAWALTRLSSIIIPYVTEYSSLRNIEVKSSDGKTNNYDLFKAKRNGDFSQDPYVRPGDTITVKRLSRSVSISGAVERPGTYQLIEGEGLQDLLEVYASGLTPLADTTKLEVLRYVDSSSRTGERLYVDSVDYKQFVLKNLDAIYIPHASDNVPIIYIEGSIIDNQRKGSSNETIDSDDIFKELYTGSTRISLRFNQGESWGSLVQRNRALFTAESDTENAYIKRSDDRVTINLDQFLYTALDEKGPIIEPNDTLVVPYRNKEAQVILAGEVISAKELSGWPLRRLSSVVSGNLTAYSSIRDIEITAVSGNTSTYDYFKSFRFGDFSQDPYVRPGDTITVKRLSRSVSISGAVERPGTYQLIEGEGLQDLLEVYASGLTPLADTTRIELVRIIDSKHSAGEKIYLTEEHIKENFSLSNYDSIQIHEITDLLPVMFMEGAVSIADDSNISISLEATNRLTIRFNEGENYAYLVRRYSNIFSSVSDTKNAYIIRDSQHISININPMLYDASYHSEYYVEADDILVIPFRQFFVTVSGSVVNPGRYPYVPDRDWNYYVSLAGGFNKIQNTNNSLIITDITGKRLSKKESIAPETVIEARANSFLFYFNHYSPVILSTFSILTGLFTIQALTR